MHAPTALFHTFSLSSRGQAISAFAPVQRPRFALESFGFQSCCRLVRTHGTSNGLSSPSFPIMFRPMLSLVSIGSFAIAAAPAQLIPLFPAPNKRQGRLSRR